MLKKHPLLSVLIATRNRQETASIVIAEILELDLPNFELVVSDTSDEKNLLQLVKARTNKTNFIYQHTSNVLSMSENYAKTIDMSTGEYICMIGDDDFILPGIVEVAEFAKTNNLPSVTQNIIYNFDWENQNDGILHGAGIPKKQIVTQSTKKALNGILLKGGMMTIDAPRLYHGIAKRSIFQELKNAHGKYFFGASPDISATVTICCLSDTYGYSLSQFTVPGASKKSNSNLGLTRQAPHMSSSDHVALHQDEIWPAIIPPLLCAEAGWPEATYKTIKVLKQEKLPELNLTYCYLLMYLKYPNQYKYLTPSLLNYLKMLTLINMVKIPVKLTYILSNILIRKLIIALIGKKITVKTLANIKNIQACIVSTYP